MSIPVTCPECDSHFHVGDEFAGLAGRCPDCAAVIHVPESVEPAAKPDLDPFWTPHAAEEPPAISRPARAEERPPPERSPPLQVREITPRFDPRARAAKWVAVSHGLRNLMVAVILIAVDLLVASAFVIVDEVKGVPQGGFGPREKAQIIGLCLTAGLCMLLWTMGRVGCARAPYVPARQLAVSSGLIAAMTGVTGLLGLGLIVGGVALAQNGNLAGLGLSALGQCALMPAMVGFFIAETLGVWSQIRMADGLHDLTFGRTSRVMMAVLVLFTTLGVCGGCGLVLLISAAQQQANKNKQQQFPPPQPNPAKVQPAPAEKEAAPQPKEQADPLPAKKVIAPPEDVVPVAPPKKEEAKEEAPAVVAAPNPPPGQAPNGNPPPPAPEVNPADQQQVIYGITIGVLVISLVYTGFCVVCFQSGRRAIQREINHLVGIPHDREHSYGEHH